MGRIAKVGISLPEEVLKAVEEQRMARGESRSGFFRRAVESLLERERESAAAREYVRRYQQVPDSADEVEAVHEVGAAALAVEPWE